MSENRTSLIAIRKSDTDTRIMSQTETKKNKTSNVSLVYYIFYSYFILFLFYIILYGFFRFCQKPFAFFGFKYVVFRQSSEHHGQHTPFVDSIHTLCRFNRHRAYRTQQSRYANPRNGSHVAGLSYFRRPLILE